MILQDLDDTFKGEEDQFELKDANEDVAEMVKAVNDSLHQVCDFTPECWGSKVLELSYPGCLRSRNPVELKVEINPEVP